MKGRKKGIQEGRIGKKKEQKRKKEKLRQSSTILCLCAIGFILLDTSHQGCVQNSGIGLSRQLFATLHNNHTARPKKENHSSLILTVYQ